MLTRIANLFCWTTYGELVEKKKTKIIKRDVNSPKKEYYCTFTWCTINIHNIFVIAFINNVGWFC